MIVLHSNTKRETDATNKIKEGLPGNEVGEEGESENRREDKKKLIYISLFLQNQLFLTLPIDRFLNLLRVRIN